MLIYKVFLGFGLETSSCLSILSRVIDCVVSVYKLQCLFLQQSNLALARLIRKIRTSNFRLKHICSSTLDSQKCFTYNCKMLHYLAYKTCVCVCVCIYMHASICLCECIRGLLSFLVWLKIFICVSIKSKKIGS